MSDVEILKEAILKRPIFEVINSELVIRMFGLDQICPHCMDISTGKLCQVEGKYINRIPKNFYVITKAIELWRVDYYLMLEFLKQNISDEYKSEIPEEDREKIKHETQE